MIMIKTYVVNFNLIELVKVVQIFQALNADEHFMWVQKGAGKYKSL